MKHENGEKSLALTCRGQARELNKRGRNVLLGVLLLYTLITALIVSPSTQLIVNLGMKLSSGGAYTNSFTAIFTRPVYLLAVIISTVLCLLWTFFGVAVPIYGYDMLRRGEVISLRTIFLRSLRGTLRILAPRNWGMLVLATIVLPFLMPSISADFLLKISIPEFILDVIYTTPVLLVLYCALVLALLYCALRMMFIYPCFLLEGETFAGAARKSLQMTRGRWLRCLWEQFLAKLRAMLPVGILYVIGTGLLLLLTVIIRNNVFSLACSVGWGYLFAPMLSALGDACGNIAYFALLDSQRALLENSEAAVAEKTKAAGKYMSRIAPACIIIAAAVFAGSVAAMTIAPHIMAKVFNSSETTVTAHRGYTLNAAENTLPAFTDAIGSGIVEYVETDVQLTKDGCVVINHDSTLSRTTGCDAAVYELTLDEIKQLTVTTEARATGEQVSAPVPTLEEVIQACKGKIKLNIEIKNFPETPDLIEKTVRLIEEYGIIDECVVTSLKYSDLEAVKALNPDIQCGYTINTAAGDYYSLSACDLFSVECTLVSGEMVEEIHKLGKQVHCWTVLSAEVAQEMADCGVDSIITNDPVLVSTALSDNANVPLTLFKVYWTLTGQGDTVPWEI